MVPDASAKALKSKSGTRKSSIFVAKESFELMHAVQVQVQRARAVLDRERDAKLGVVPESWFVIVVMLPLAATV
jgi:hypothetical protein